MNEHRRRVVVTGLGTFNPLGHDPQETWQQVAAGNSGIGPITLFDASEFKSQIAAEVKEFDPIALFGRRDARRMARATQLALAAAAQALDDAALPINDGNRDRIGVLVGSGMGIMDPIIENQITLQERGPTRVSPFFVPMMLADTPAATISIQYGLRGPNMAVFTACATGNNAIGEAADKIRLGRADVMLAGSTEAAILPLSIAGYSVMGALTSWEGAPEQALRPFDLHRDGFVPGEGAGILVLEALEHAQARGARIYAELLGYGATADAYHISMPAENGVGAARCIQVALADAGLTPADVDYINAHGTGTQMNDKGETAAIKAVFGETAYEVPVSSTKAMHGHLLGAAGALEAIVCLQAMQANVLPPTMNYVTADPDCDLDYVPNMARPATIDVVMSNTFGLGGHNATLIFGRYRAESAVNGHEGHAR